MSQERVDKAAAGIEASVVSLTERLTVTPHDKSIEQEIRLLEALLFAAVEPIDIETLRDRMPEETDVGALLARLARDYAGRGVNLVRVANRWRFQTAPDLEPSLVDIKEAPRKLSKAALETLAIISYLMELGWIRLRGRRRTPGRPVTYGTTESFLAHFNLETIADLPGRDDLKAAGLLDPRLPKDFEMPEPIMPDDLTADEAPIEEEDDPEFFEDFLEEDKGDRA